MPDADRVKHLEMIQSVVSRMASNSFVLKGWAVTLVAGLFALGAKDADATLMFLALLPAVVFWGLDGYFLWQERSYAWLYRAVAATYLNANTHELPKIDLFDMNASESKGRCPKCGWLRSVVSVRLVAFYGVVLAGIVAAGITVHLRPPAKEAAAAKTAAAKPAAAKGSPSNVAGARTP